MVGPVEGLRVGNTGLKGEFTDGSSSIAGCSKRLISKAAGESKPEAYPQGYVEDFDEPRTPLADFFNSLLNGFLNFAATQAPCANPNAFGLTVDQRSDWLKVGLEDPLGLVIGMTDVMT